MQILLSPLGISTLAAICVGIITYNLSSSSIKNKVTVATNSQDETYAKANDEVFYNVKSVVLNDIDLRAFHKTVATNVAAKYEIDINQLHGYDLTISFIIDDIMQSYYLTMDQKHDLTFRLINNLSNELVEEKAFESMLLLTSKKLKQSDCIILSLINMALTFIASYFIASNNNSGLIDMMQLSIITIVSAIIVGVGYSIRKFIPALRSRKMKGRRR